MTASRWDRMWELFHNGLECPPDERAAMLDSKCEGDEELRREVESLFEAHSDLEQADGGDPLLVTPASHGESLASLPDPPLDALLGTELGPYRLLRVLGSGGMGVVYLAERIDGEVEQQVAIKLLPTWTRDAEGMRRFRQERQILASLDHPHVARLLDAGTTEDGRPYFVMEYVEGEPIDRYCARKKLSIPARIELLRTVCGAVHGIHQSLVIHRDLKPGNILVTADGVPKLLDFGIAKLLEGGPGSWAGQPTSATWRPLTPAYASPEQLQGRVITTASDIYALGVLLYELLSGQHPFPAATSSPLELARLVCETAPGPPSAALAAGRASTPEGLEDTPERLARRLRGDLDTIVLRAMHRDPSRRYSSAERLADDLGRYLEGRPVRARKDTFRYRTGKLLRRHPFGAFSAAAATVLLIAFAATMTVQSARLEDERARAERQAVEAERERERAERVSEFLVDLFRVSYPSRARGESITARELLDRGAQRIAVGLEDEPEVQARLFDTVGKVYQALGLYAEASPHLERSLALLRQVHGDNHAEVAEGLFQLATLAQARGQYDTAEKFHREAVAMRRSLFGDKAAEVATSLNALAVVLHEAGDYDRAEAAHREALEIRKKTAGPKSWQVSQSLQNLGWLLHDRGRFDEAEPLYAESLALNRELLGEEHRWVAKSLNNVGLLHHDRGELDLAEVYYRQAWELDQRLLGEQELHPDLAGHLHNQARLADDRGDLDQALELHQRALEIRQRALPPSHPAIAASLTGLGRVLLDRGDAPAAEPLLRQALDIRRQRFADDNWHIAETESLLGACLLALGRIDEAAPLLQASTPIITAQRGPEDLRSRQAAARLAELEALHDVAARR